MMTRKRLRRRRRRRRRRMKEEDEDNYNWPLLYNTVDIGHKAIVNLYHFVSPPRTCH
jgi:hypothetical protein